MFSNQIKNIHQKYKDGKITKEEQKTAIGILVKYEMRIKKSKDRAHTFSFMFY
ncbi:MAG: hypothetical protein PF574_00520 [Candidatus Delongbacteria bacterium]|jgi:hypothetical protein|nr:hypothetical protein [Candidatus Delongbacteria bacterium]